jgi:hypothetical protein
VAPAAPLLPGNGQAYRVQRLKAAFTAILPGQAPLELLLREGTVYRSVRIDCRASGLGMHHSNGATIIEAEQQGQGERTVVSSAAAAMTGCPSVSAARQQHCTGAGRTSSS